MKLLSERHGGELRLMVQCLELYYRQGRSQKDIAAALGVSAATVSRLLKRAMDEGLVRVELDLPRTPELETALAFPAALIEPVAVNTTTICSRSTRPRRTGDAPTGCPVARRIA